MTMTVLRPVTITDTQFSTSTVPEADYAVWSSGTTYVVADRVIYNHMIYESLQVSNLNKNPATDTSSPPFWIQVSSTNRWKMFDQQVNSSTTATNSIVVELFPGSIDSLGLTEIVGNTVRVQMYDGSTLMYDQTQNIDNTYMADWYAYFFSYYDLASALIFSGLPRILGAKVKVTITGSGAVSCGGCFMGGTYSLGLTQYGATAGIIDYSKKTTNSFGITTVSVGAFSKRASVKLLLNNTELRRVQALLASLRSTFCLWVGLDSDTQTYAPLVLYGFWKDFSLEIAYPTQSFCTLDIEGVI